MKMILFLHVVTALAMSSCGLLSRKENLCEFIPGTYVSEWTTEFAASRDTLQIKVQAGSAQYEITRRTYHHYNPETKPLPPQYKVDHWTGSYAEREKVILVHRNGRILSFNPEKGEMKMGVTVYKKL